MKIIDIVNIIAIVVAPIVAVIVGQHLQNRECKRADKMEIFKTLMINRGFGWSADGVKALNIIEVVFSDDKKVLQQWKTYYDKLWVENPTDIDLSKIKTEGDKLLDVMAKSLGYKEKVTWETIQKPYLPKGLADNVLQQQQYHDSMLYIANYMSANMQQMSATADKENNHGEDENGIG